MYRPLQYFGILIISGLACLAKPAQASTASVSINADSREAKGSADDFIGYWLTSHEDEGAYYLCIHPDGKASRFYKNRADTEVYFGKWRYQVEDVDGNREQQGLGPVPRIFVEWDNGEVDELTYYVEGVMRRAFATKAGDRKALPHPTRLIAIANSDVGNLTQYLVPSDKATKDELRNEFIRTWRASGEESEQSAPFFIIVEENGRAASTRASGPNGIKGERGYWELTSSGVAITWGSGQRDILTRKGAAYERIRYKPPLAPGQEPSYSGELFPAEIEAVDPDWLLGYENEKREDNKKRYFWNKKKSARAGSDLKGYWKLVEDQETVSVIQLSSIGLTGLGDARLWGFQDDFERERWKVSSKSALIEWRSGQRAVLSPTRHHTYRLQFFEKDQSLTEVPKEQLQAIPISKKEAQILIRALAD